MVRRRARGIAILLGACVAALAVYALLALPPEQAVAPSRVAARAAELPPPTLAPRGLSGPAPAEAAAVPVGAPEAIANEDADDGEEPDGSPLFPRLEVTVRLEDGSWPAGASAFAYALRAGAPGAGGPVARADLVEDGTCELRLPGPGRYDIGAVGPGELPWTLTSDVDVPATSRIELRMPAIAAIRFVRSPVSPPGAGSMTVRLDEGQGGAATPGRGEVRAADAVLELGSLPATWTAPSSVRYVIDRGNGGYRALPRVFTAPGTVTIDGDVGRYVLRVRLEPQDRVEPTEGAMTVNIEVEGGGVVDRWGGLSGTWLVREGKRLGDVYPSHTFCQSPPAARSVVRWWGDGILPGSVEVYVPDRVTVDVPVVIRRDESVPLEPRRRAVARIEGSVPPGEVGLLVVRRADDFCDREEVDALGRDFPVWIAERDGPFEAIAVGPGVASDPLPFEVGRGHVFPLRPAGFLRVVRSVRPPDGIELVFRRKDGQLFCDGTQPPSGLEAVHRIALHDDEIRIGPLPEGDVTFLVCSGSETLAEVTAHVVPYRTTDLVLPLKDRLGRR